MWGWLVCVAAATVLSVADGAGAGAARLVCYVEGARAGGFAECTHLVYAGDARGDKLETLLKDYRKNNPRLKIILRVAEVDKDLRKLLKSKYVQGLEIYEAHKALNKTKVSETVEAARAALTSSGGGPLFLALPAHPELLAKYYDLMTLVKKADLMMVQTHALGQVKKMTYHPSRLSGLWDMMNTDSVVDLVVGLGVPASKVVISLPATARQFTLANETLSTPGSPTVDDEPKEVGQAELCRQLQKGGWTLERDQDLSAPYAFKNKTWMAFEDASSVDVKGKYARVRGLAGLALHRAELDSETACAPSLKTSLAKVLNQQSRAPRAAVLRSLEHEILSAPSHARALDALQVSPYRITQVVDSDGVIHSIREDTRTEFSCSRQGYFVHPRSCGRFYRCVKFDQLSPEYTVFEFDCPAGLAFDSRYEVCVWPGSLPDSQACPGSSEIAPVPKTRFICPQHEGYYADPENCRWFFACLDHGKSPLTAYEFRCPFGLGFDAERLKCDWPWVVPACGNIARYEAEAYGFSSAALTGAAGYKGQTADAINVAAHQSLVSGASLDNLVGIQGGFLSHGDALDSNYIASQELTNDAYSTDVSSGTHSSNPGLVQTTKYNNNEGKYSSGSIILDEYRLPTKAQGAQIVGHGQATAQYNTGYSQGQAGYTKGYSGQTVQYQSGNEDSSGAYVHDPTGDYAEPYRHVGSPDVPYVHSDSAYKHSGDYYDAGSYSGASQSDFSAKYAENNGGQYVHDNSGAYVATDSYNEGYKGDITSGAYNADYSGSYVDDNSGKYQDGVYRTDGHIGEGSKGSNGYESYSTGNAGNYLSDAKAYTGASHTLTAGAINVGLVGKTTLVDFDYSNHGNYQAGVNTISQQTLHPAHVSFVSQPAVSINHIGTDGNNLDGYSFVTTPTSSGIPTTATPFAVTSAIPTATYKATFVPAPPKTSIKQVFGYSQPAVTTVRPALVAVKEYTPKIREYNQGFNYKFENKDYSNYNGASSANENSESSGYEYSKPSVNFEDGATYSAPAVTTYNPQGFGHSSQTIHKVEAVNFQYSTPTPITEEPFKRIVAYTTGPSVSTYVQPTESTYNPQSFSHQTVHKVEAGNAYSSNSGADYKYEGQVGFQQPETVVQYTTAQPTVDYQPQVFSQQTLHKVDTSKINTYSQDSSSGYDYSKPSINFEEGVRTVQYSTPAPVVVSSTYKPQSYSQQTIHKDETQKFIPVSSTAAPSVSFSYQAPVSVYQNPLLQYTQKEAPTKSQAYSHSTVHKLDNSEGYSSASNIGSGYEYKSDITYEQPQTFVQYTTPQPTIAAQPVVSTYQPQAYSQQTIHKVDASQVDAYSQDSGYEYSKPAVKLQEAKTVYKFSTPAPAVVSSTYKPQSYSSQTVHRVQAQKYVPVSSTALPQVDLSYQQVSTYENPILKYVNKVTPVTYAAPTPTVFTQTYQPLVRHEVSHIVNQPQYQSTVQHNYENVQLNQEGYTYSQPEIQRNVETNAKSYSDASVVSHQYYHQSNGKSNYDNSYKDVVFVSTSPSTLAYEDHYEEYEAPKKVEAYRAPEYVPPKENYRAYSIVSSTSAPIIQQSSVFHQDQKVEAYKAPEYIPPKQTYQQSYAVPSTSAPIVHQSSVFHQTNDEYDYKPVEYSQQYETVQNSVPTQQHVSFSTSHITEPKNVESVHFSSFPTVTAKYSQASYEAPEIQVGYKAEEYLPPVVSSAVPVVTSTYKPRTYSTTTREYLPPVENTYLPPSSTPRTVYKSSTPSYEYVESTTAYKASEYLPPAETDSRTINFESFGFDNIDVSASPKIKYNPYQDYSVPRDIPVVTSAPKRKQNIVVQNAKSNLLGFGTVGPDAGLISPVTYTTAAPDFISTTYRPIFKSSTYTPSYTESTPQYKAPEYLPPLEQSEPRTVGRTYSSAPVHRKNIVAEARAKAQRLSIGAVESEAGYVSNTYSTAAPIVVSSESYSLSPKTVTSTYAPVEQGLFEVPPSSVPFKRTKPKVAVVTKLNDFNPLLVRKLGAVCSCQSPVLVLKGRRPNVQRDYDDSGYDYEDSNRGDINENQWAYKNSNIQSVVTPAPIVTSTFNPIIVPDDSYYQDYQEPSHAEVVVTPKRQEAYVSSTPAVATQRVYTVRPRVKAVTIAPTYKTVLLNQEEAPTALINESDAVVSGVESQAFDRYGPGGWRSRDETLQGSVDCQRAGLFRHPKQCNKFYACRWDCTKQRFTLHVFNCPIQLSFDANIGACNWPSQGPACQGDTLLTNAL